MHRSRIFLAPPLMLLAILASWPADVISGSTRMPTPAAPPSAPNLQQITSALSVGPPGVAPVEAKEPVSLLPRIALVGTSEAQAYKLSAAVSRFTDLGLALPDLEVHFFSDEAECGGHKGLFEADYRPWRISICSGLEFVYEHELAHAWDLANLTDADRSDFMDRMGLERWNRVGDEWSERGVEMAAFIIQQGLLDRPLPAGSAQTLEMLATFEALTGVASPRLG